MTLRRFHGIVPPVVTPLLDRDTLDLQGLDRLLERLLTGGVHGLFILGTTGEAPSLSYRCRREMIQETCQRTAGRVPVLVGVTDTAFVESVDLARHAADCGADAVVLSAPYYFPAGQTELESYLRNIVRELPLPLMLYNMPALTKITFEPETLRRLTDLPQVVGLKDSSGDLDYFQNVIQLRAQRPDWSLLIGQESLLPNAIAMGGDGGVTGGANVFPALFVKCYEAAVAGDEATVARLMKLIDEFQQIYNVGKYGSRFIKGTKCSLSLLDVCNDAMAEPFHRFHPSDREKVRAIIDPLNQRLQEALS